MVVCTGPGGGSGGGYAGSSPARVMARRRRGVMGKQQKDKAGKKAQQRKRKREAERAEKAKTTRRKEDEKTVRKKRMTEEEYAATIDAQVEINRALQHDIKRLKAQVVQLHSMVVVHDAAMDIAMGKLGISSREMGELVAETIEKRRRLKESDTLPIKIPPESKSPGPQSVEDPEEGVGPTQEPNTDESPPLAAETADSDEGSLITCAHGRRVGEYCPHCVDRVAVGVQEAGPASEGVAVKEKVSARIKERLGEARKA